MVAGKRCRDNPIDRESSRAFHEHADSQGDCQQMKFKAFARLLARPIHEETDLTMHENNCDEHVCHHAESRDSRQQPNNKTQASQKLSCDREHGERLTNSHLTKHVDCSVESRPVKPSQCFLGAVGKKDNAQNKSHGCDRIIVVRAKNTLRHDLSSSRIWTRSFNLRQR